jgi:hypothetical protein
MNTNNRVFKIRSPKVGASFVAYIKGSKKIKVLFNQPVIRIVSLTNRNPDTTAKIAQVLFSGFISLRNNLPKLNIKYIPKKKQIVAKSLSPRFPVLPEFEKSTLKISFPDWLRTAFSESFNLAFTICEPAGSLKCLFAPFLRNRF